MGWRKTQSDVQSGRVSFAKPKDNFKGFANAANIIAKSWMQDAADEKEAEKLRIKEEKAQRKRIRNAQAAAETKDKKLRSNATILAETYTGDPKNKAAVDYFYQQLVLKDGNIGSVETSTQTRIKDGQLEFTAGTTEPGLPIQGPNIPINPEIKGFNVGFGDEKETAYKDAREITVNDLPGIAEGDYPESAKAEASQMNEMFGGFSEGTILPGEVDEETGETIGPDITTPGGVKITPYGKGSPKLDVTKLKDLDTIRLYEMELKSNGSTLNAEDQELLNSEKDRLKKVTEDLTETEAINFRKSLITMDVKDLNGIIASNDHSEASKAAALIQKNSRKDEPFNLLDYDDVETSTIQSIVDLSGSHPAMISGNIVELQTLLSNRNKETAPIGDGETFIIKVTGEDGLLETVTAKLNTNNQWVDLNNPTQTVIPAENTSVMRLEGQGELFDRVVKIKQSTIAPLKKQRIAMSATLRSAKKLDDMVNPAMGGDPKILTVVGGNLTRFIQGLALEGEALADTVVKVFNKDGPQKTLAMIESRIQANIPAGVDEAARLAYLFQAEKIKLAFSFAASSMGQSGQGLSNKDFENAMETIDSGKDYETFTKNLRSQASSVVEKTEELIANFNTDDAVKILKSMQDGLFEGYGQTAEEYAERTNLSDAYTWSQAAYKAPESSADPVTINDDAGYKALGPEVLYRNSSGSLSRTPATKIAGEM